MAVILRVGIPRSSPPLVSECVSTQLIRDGGQFHICKKPGIYIELFEFLAQTMNVSIKWHLFDSNNVVNQWLKEGKLDASARMKEQTALLNDEDMTACDYGLYEKVVYLFKRPTASEMAPLNLLAPFDILVWLKIGLLIFAIFCFMIYFSLSRPHSWSATLIGERLFDTFTISVKQYDFGTIGSAGEVTFILTVVNGLYFLALCYEYFLLDGMCLNSILAIFCNF